jgi:HAD superfamily hydrolase (TIGR01549 family)
MKPNAYSNIRQQSFFLELRERRKAMGNIKMLSFDMDGTITDLSFVESVWLEGVPRLLALENRIPLEEARTFVKCEYDKIGKERLEWYDLSYWIRKLKLKISSEELLNSFKERIRIFPEVTETLQVFKEKGFRLIILSNARREFLDLELKETDISHFFERTFSSTSDFRLTKKTGDIYLKVCNVCGVSPSELVHVGDDRHFDFDIPQKLGIKTFHLDRAGIHSGETVVHNLKELVEKVNLN